MKKFLFVSLALLAVACSTSQTKDNDPWGKLSDDVVEKAKEEEAKKSKVVELSMYSSVMKQNMTYSLWLPREYDSEKSYPFLYLLHGYEYGDQSRLDRCWLDKGNAAEIAEKYQKNGGGAMIIVMPNGLSSFYIGDYETYFHEELMPKVEADYKGNGKRAIAGLSMGGFGTLWNSTKYPEKFTYAYAMSPASSWYGMDPKNNIKSYADKSVFPAFTIEIGTEDMTVNNSDSKSLYSFMISNGITCELIERGGTHDWAFWQACLPKALAKADESFK